MLKHRFIPLILAASLMVAASFHAAWAAPEDLLEAFKLKMEGDKVGAYLKFKELAPDGDAVAQYELAGFYHYGWAGPANFKLAREWYDRAARQGYPDAMLGLAIMDAQGQAGPADKKSAFTWLTIASTILKNPDEIKKVSGLRDLYKSELSTADLNAALAEAMAFQPVKEQH